MSKISHERIGQYMKEALIVLKEHDGTLPTREIIKTVRTRLDPTDYELHVYEKTGYVRWESTLYFYSINLSKAGYIRKQKGYWILTSEGEDAIKLSNLQLFQNAREAFRIWKASQPIEEGEEMVEEKISEGNIELRTFSLDQAESNALQGIQKHIDTLNPYEFQDLVAALLRAMGFHTPIIASKGRDGGVDIVAYKDPLGVEVPRIKVQVKHRDQKANAQTVRELLGILRKDGDVGLIVSSGGFTSDAVDEMRRSPVHIEAIGMKELIALWEEHYDKVEEDMKALLPLKRIAFLDTH